MEFCKDFLDYFSFTWNCKKAFDILDKNLKKNADSEKPESSTLETAEAEVDIIKLEDTNNCRAQIGSKLDNNYQLNCQPSLFTQSRKREYPWKEKLFSHMEIYSNDICEFIDESKETEIFNKLKKIIDSECVDVPSWIRRYYCKLRVRRQKLKNFDRKLLKLDFNFIQQTSKTTSVSVLDRFCLTNSHQSSYDGFQSRLAGICSYELFESPYSGRILHPFIFRDKKCLPTRLKLMCELQYAANQEVPERASIDYCYVRPQHIPAINCLLQFLFWPGIDMSESLSYPDFTVVALYKRLVIGCGFLVPDVGHNEAYISFLAVRPDWQRSGIATFMLYHLTQTCPGKDITLHVSVNNPAVCVYQKFGFKTEEFILDFYEKYLPIETGNSSAVHAIFLRLSR